jgi:hypothetical protein
LDLEVQAVRQVPEQQENKEDRPFYLKLQEVAIALLRLAADLVLCLIPQLAVAEVAADLVVQT